jgi:hypothetical protein
MMIWTETDSCLLLPAFRAVWRMLSATLIACALLAATEAQAQQAKVIHAEPGQNVTLHQAWNYGGTVWVRIVDARTGEPASATFWSIGLFRNYEHGTHIGSAALKIWGIRDELRAGQISVPTLFLVTANGGVWGTISSGGVEAACSYLGVECPLPQVP